MLHKDVLYKVHKDLDVFILLTHVVFSIKKLGGTQYYLTVTQNFLIKKISVYM